MLRITVEENAKTIVMKLEGRVTGPWAAELGRLWKETGPTLANRKLALDLRGTTYADAWGIRELKDIYSQTKAEILTATPWTQYLADEVKRNDADREEEEN